MFDKPLEDMDSDHELPVSSTDKPVVKESPVTDINKPDSMQENGLPQDNDEQSDVSQPDEPVTEEDPVPLPQNPPEHNRTQG